MLEDAQAKVSETERGQLWVQRTNEVLVEPLRFFDLEADAFDRSEFLLW